MYMKSTCLVQSGQALCVMPDFCELMSFDYVDYIDSEYLVSLVTSIPSGSYILSVSFLLGFLIP